jgi:hypothetical protein
MIISLQLKVGKQDHNCSVYLTQNILKTVGAEDSKTTVIILSLKKRYETKQRPRKKLQKP